jgi:hypothetical protein
MNLNWKRIILLISFVAAVILFGFLLYYFFLRPALPGQPSANLNANAGPGVLPQAGVNGNIPVGGNINGGLAGQGNVNLGPPTEIPPSAISPAAVANGSLTATKALTTNRVYQATLGSDGSSAYYYDKTNGLFYQITPDGKSTPLTDTIFYNVEKVTWSPNREKAVLEYPDGANVIYDFKNKTQVTLPKHWKDFSFSPTNQQLVFKSIGTTGENSWLAVVNSDGTKAEKIERLGDKDQTVYTAWSPNSQIIAMYTGDKNFDQQYLYFIGLNNENFKATIIDGRGFSGQWSSKGDRLLYSVYSDATNYKPNLWIVAAQGETIGQNRKNLNLETWTDKCTFADNDNIYCAVPRSLPEGSGIFSNDLDAEPCDIYKIDLISGFKSKIAIPEGNHNIENISITNNGQFLYFTSKTDGKLYKINLK